jgi:hypothetical protein
VPSPADYVRFAARCVDLAEADATHRTLYLEMANAWLALASERIPIPTDPDLFVPSLFQESDRATS